MSRSITPSVSCRPVRDPVFVGHPGEQGGEAIGGSLNRVEVLLPERRAPGRDGGDALRIAAGAAERLRLVGRGVEQGGQLASQ